MQFRDLKAQYQALKQDIDHAVWEALEDCNFISGSQVSELEHLLAEYVGVKHCITCGNGTDAISLALAAWGIGAGDAVFVPDFTFFSSGESPAGRGAVPIFVDVDARTFNLNPVKLEETVLAVKKEGKYTPKAVVAVDLFGLCADYASIRLICKKYGLLLLEDGAQGFGGHLKGKRACSFGDISTTSFFPAKPLGCYGDGGAIFTDHDDWTETLRSLTVHGKNREDKYDNIRIGMNSRLDTLQAAILKVKFEAFQKYELTSVNQAAKWYGEELDGSGLTLPLIPDGYYSSWAQYTVQLPEGINRQEVQDKLKEAGVPTMIYYRKPMHIQGAFAGTDSSKAYCPVTEKLCKTVLSLPMHPYMERKDVRKAADILRSVCVR
ncbi:DegT/DnrJ/EryC1/StrS aminotransferase family protein [Lachnospiraceae bacterium 48-21]